MNMFFRAALQRTEKVTKTDVRYVARSGFWLGLGQVCSALIAIGLTVAFANLVSPETYGTYRYILSTYALLTIFALPGLDTALTQSVSRGLDGSLAQSFRLRLRWGTLGSAASLALAGYYYLIQHNVSLAACFALVALALPALEAGILYQPFLNGRKLFREWALMDVASQVAAAAAIVATMLVTKSVVAIAAVYLASYALTRGAAVYICARRLRRNVNEDPELASYSRSVTAFQVISRVTASIDQVVLFNVLGPAQVAVFALASAVPNRIQSLLRTSGAIAFPKLTERRLEDVRRTLPRKLAFFGVAVLAVAGLYVALAPTAFAWLFPRYLPAVGYSQVLVLYTLSAVTYPIGAAFFAHKIVRPNYVMSLASLGVKVVALLALVPIPGVGVWGAVFSTLAASAVTLILGFYYLSRSSSVQPQPLG